MFYKAIIFDIDNTLYNYTECHEKGLNKVFNHIEENYFIKKDALQKVYDKITTKVKYELDGTASSHNKAIYFKKIIEYFNLDFYIVDTLQKIYWKQFLEEIIEFEGVTQFIRWNHELGIKIGILTDYETEYQIQKLQRLYILKYIDVIVTSEEVGIEKPSAQMFQTMLQKMNLRHDEVIMIGDSYSKDIAGAYNMDILSYWYTQENQACQPNKPHQPLSSITTPFSSWIELYKKFKEINMHLENLATLSRYVGERFDLVQGGGGNSSVKYNDWLFIKSSGISMSNICTDDGYTIIKNKELAEDIYNNTTKDVINYTVMKQTRSSIETYMHSILKKYTVHLHPIQVNRILITADARSTITKLFPETDILIIDYFTPGIKVCNEIKKLYRNENIIFLLNHGLIITADDYNDIYKYLNDVITTIEMTFSYDKPNIQPLLNNNLIDSHPANKCEQNSTTILDLTRYKYTNTISKYIYDKYNIHTMTYLCENKTIDTILKTNPELFKEAHTFPDELIYCGIKIACIDNLEDIDALYTLYQELPKIIIINHSIYIICHSLSKCREIEEVLLSTLLIKYNVINKNFLTPDEICFLNNWDAEKYRQLI